VPKQAASSQGFYVGRHHTARMGVYATVAV